MPSGARVRGPGYVSLLLAQSLVGNFTGWCDKGIFINLSTLLAGKEQVLVCLALGLQDGLCSIVHGILVVEGDLERRLRGFVSWCFGIEALETGIKRLSRRADVQMADGVLLVVCCERSHCGRYIERTVCGVVVFSVR
jgi:hypothetical protein